MSILTKLISPNFDFTIQRLCLEISHLYYCVFNQSLIANSSFKFILAVGVEGRDKKVQTTAYLGLIK